MTRPAPTVTVPREPTEAMLEVLDDAAWFDEGGYQGQESSADTYRKLLAAAPAAPQAAGVGERTHPTGEAIQDALIAGFLHGVGMGPWDDMHDYIAVCARDYVNGDPLPLRAPSREPEGGAVDDVQKRVERIVFEDFYGSPVAGSKERLAKALIREFGLAALATRGEAPAEAGEVWPVGSWLSAALDDPKVCDEMKADIRLWFDGGGHLRAQPQAREDAQPVAWFRRSKANPDAWYQIDQRDVSLHRSRGEEVQSIPAVTRPAPAAPRVALDDALHFYALGQQDAGHRAKQALAALQAEQKGGA